MYYERDSRTSRHKNNGWEKNDLRKKKFLKIDKIKYSYAVKQSSIKRN